MWVLFYARFYKDINTEVFYKNETKNSSQYTYVGARNVYIILWIRMIEDVYKLNYARIT